MATRYLADAQRDLATAEAAIKSNRKQERDNPNPKSVAIAESVFPSLVRKRDALLAEIAAGLPQRPAHSFDGRDMGGTLKLGNRNYEREPMTQAEIDGLEIPAFLRRV